MSQPLDQHSSRKNSYQQSSRKISFSWEKKPGVSKVSTTTTQTHGDGDDENLPSKDQEILAKLPPPPICTQESTNTPRNHVHDFQNIPLPPCAFQPPYYRTSSKRGLWVQDHDDPFLAAYKECTKNQRIGGGGERKNKKKLESKLKKGMFSIFTCKGSCGVHDNNLVRISSLPHNIDRD